MTYYSYIGGTGLYETGEGSGNQTYMVDDLAALQVRVRRENFNTYAGNTVYTWSPTTGETFIDRSVGQGASSANKVCEAIWDGGGIDTYNLSNYSTDLYIQLDPGEWSNLFDGPACRSRWLRELTWQWAMSPTPISTTTIRARSSRTP